MVVLVDQSGKSLAHRFVKAKPASIEENLVNVGGANATIYSAHSLVSDYDRYAMDGTAIKVWLVTFSLKLSLQLHPTQRRSAPFSSLLMSIEPRQGVIEQDCRINMGDLPVWCEE